jgi:membrane-bound serine protease (ClpP class)
MDDREAQELGFSFASVNSIEEMLDSIHINDYTITRIVESWSEKFAGFIGKIAPILLMIGFAGVYMEMKTPGFGVFGIVGIICLALVFGSQYMVGLADYTELLIIMLGLALLVVELFVIPGFGIVGISGILLIAAGMVLSLQDFVLPKPEMPWQKEILETNITRIFISLGGSVVILILFFKYLFPRLAAVVSGPYLSATLDGSSNTTSTIASVTIGDTGTVAKKLRPSGIVRIGDMNIDAITEGDFIDTGTSVVVTEIRGNHIVVMQKTEQ